jgi:hypothetical protein
VLNQPAFPKAFDRQLFSYWDDEVKLDNGLEMALNWIGIHDGIRIDFTTREDFNALKGHRRLRATEKEGGFDHRPFYKQEALDETIYIIPEDMTVGELRYFIEEIDGLIEAGAGSLSLSDETPTRFRNMAVFLSKQTVPETFSPERRRRYRQHVELLYFLGGLLKATPQYRTVPFEQIKQMPLTVHEPRAVEDFIEKMKHFLDLSEHKLGDKDAMLWWTRNAARHIRAMFALAMRERFEYVVFKKGIEEMTKMEAQAMGPVRAQDAVEDTEDPPKTEEALLWAQLPFDQWRAMRESKVPEQERAMILAIQQYMEQYKGWRHERVMDYSPYYIKMVQELNCLGRSCLIARILKEIGFTEDRIFLASYQQHSFIILELADGTYFNIQTYREPLADTKPIPEEVLPSHFLSETLSQRRSVFLNIEADRKVPGSPLKQSVTVHNITEGLMSSILGNLLWDIYDTRKQEAEHDESELLDFVIAGFQKILLFEKNDFDALENLAAAFGLKSQIRFANAVSLADLKDAIRLLDKAIDYQSRVVKFLPRSTQRAAILNQYKETRTEYRDALQKKEKSFAVNVSYLDQALDRIPGLDTSQKVAFRQYLIDNGLYKYEHLIPLFNAPTVEYLLDDPAVKPVFLEALGQGEREPVVTHDHAALRQLGLDPRADVEKGLGRWLGFRIGQPEDADYLLTLDPSRKIMVGIASNSAAVARRMNPHGRQSFLVLEDGTLIGLKGSGQNLDETSPSIEWDEVKDRYSGTMALWEARRAEESLKDLDGTPARLMQYLGYTRLHAVPETDGTTASVDDMLYQGQTLYKPAVGIYRVATPHRVSEFRRLLSLDPDLRNTRKHIRRALISLGRLPEDAPWSAEAFMRNMMQGFGVTEAVKHNRGWYKQTFHQQDLLLSGDESDNEEFERTADQKLLWNQMRVKVNALSTMVAAIQLQEKRQGRSSALLPEKDSAYRLLKELMTAYFGALDTQKLRTWTQSAETFKEGGFFSAALAGVPLERFYVEPTSGATEGLMRKKLLRDMRQWALDALQERQQEDFAQVASPDIPHFFHATKLDNLIRMMRIGKIPAVGGKTQRVYLNEAKKESPGYFGNIILYLDHERLRNNGITVSRIPDTPYYESRKDIPFSMITNLEYARVFKDPLLVLALDERARALGVDKEPEFRQSREILLSVIFPDLSETERQVVLDEKLHSKIKRTRDTLDHLPEEVPVVGLGFKLPQAQLRQLVASSHIKFVNGAFYLARQNRTLDQQEKEMGAQRAVRDGHKVFTGDLSRFVQLDDASVQEEMIRFLRESEALQLSEAQIRQMNRLAHLLSKPEVFHKRDAAQTLSELKAALKKDRDFPFVAYDGAYHARRILSANGFDVRMIETRSPDDRDVYYFAELTFLGQEWIVDVTADQFEVAQEADRSRMVFQTQYKDMGVVMVPRALARSPEYRDQVPMYTVWERQEVNTDHAMTVSPSQDKVGGIDLNLEPVAIESTGNEILFQGDELMQELDNLQGFTPMIYQIVPVHHLPMILGLQDASATDTVGDIVYENK